MDDEYVKYRIPRLETYNPGMGMKYLPGISHEIRQKGFKNLHSTTDSYPGGAGTMAGTLVFTPNLSGRLEMLPPANSEVVKLAAQMPPSGSVPRIVNVTGPADPIILPTLRGIHNPAISTQFQTAGLNSTPSTGHIVNTAEGSGTASSLTAYDYLFGQMQGPGGGGIASLPFNDKGDVLSTVSSLPLGAQVINIPTTIPDSVAQAILNLNAFLTEGSKGFKATDNNRLIDTLNAIRKDLQERDNQLPFVKNAASQSSMASVNEPLYDAISKLQIGQDKLVEQNELLTQALMKKDPRAADDYQQLIQYNAQNADAIAASFNQSIAGLASMDAENTSTIVEVLNKNMQASEGTGNEIVQNLVMQGSLLNNVYESLQQILAGDSRTSMAITSRLEALARMMVRIGENSDAALQAILTQNENAKNLTSIITATNDTQLALSDDQMTMFTNFMESIFNRLRAEYVQQQMDIDMPPNAENTPQFKPNIPTDPAEYARAVIAAYTRSMRPLEDHTLISGFDLKLSDEERLGYAQQIQAFLQYGAQPGENPIKEFLRDIVRRAIRHQTVSTPGLVNAIAATVVERCFFGVMDPDATYEPWVKILYTMQTLISQNDLTNSDQNSADGPPLPFGMVEILSNSNPNLIGGFDDGLNHQSTESESQKSPDEVQEGVRDAPTLQEYSAVKPNARIQNLSDKLLQSVNFEDIAAKHPDGPPVERLVAMVVAALGGRNLSTGDTETSNTEYALIIANIVKRFADVAQIPLDDSLLDAATQQVLAVRPLKLPRTSSISSERDRKKKASRGTTSAKVLLRNESNLNKEDTTPRRSPRKPPRKDYKE